LTVCEHGMVKHPANLFLDMLQRPPVGAFLGLICCSAHANSPNVSNSSA